MSENWIHRRCRRPPVDRLPAHDHRHVLGEDSGVEGLGQRVGRDAVGAEVLDDDLVSLLHRVDVHEADRDVLGPRVERFVRGVSERDRADVVLTNRHRRGQVLHVKVAEELLEVRQFPGRFVERVELTLGR